MSSRKDLKRGPKTLPSSQKNYPESSHKKTAPKKQIQFPESLKSNRKNLMVEFDRIQKEPSKVEEGQLDKMSSVVSNSVSSSQVSEDVMKSYVVKEDNYGYQLPRSYVIAMSGLQQVVNQKQSEVKNIARELQENISQNQSLLDQLQKLQAKERQSQLKITQLQSHVKLLKQTSTDCQKTIFESEQRRVQFERQTSKENHKKEQKINAQQIEIKQLRSQLDKLQAQNKQLKKENKKIGELREIQEQLKVEKAERAKAEEQIKILKEQAIILAEGVVKAEDVNLRQPLAEVIAANSLRREASVPKVQPLDLQRIQRRHQTDRKQSSNMQQILSNARPASNAKKQPEPPLPRERSLTTTKQKQSPQLVSQYRQLMRHEKELIGLNYQLELLEKSMTGRCQGRGQLTRNYQKLRRECQQKQMTIRQLKLFLNDPIR